MTLVVLPFNGRAILSYEHLQIITCITLHNKEKLAVASVANFHFSR